MVNISVSLETRQTLDVSPFRAASSPPTTTQLPPPGGHKPRGAWPWGPRGRTVPGHAGQQLKHGVQHVAVALFQLKQPEGRDRAGLRRRCGRSPAPQHRPEGTAGPLAHPSLAVLPAARPVASSRSPPWGSRQQRLFAAIYQQSQEALRGARTRPGWRGKKGTEATPTQEPGARRLRGQERATMYGKEVDIPPTPATTTGARLRGPLERHGPRLPSPPPPLLPGRTRMGSWPDTHKETQASEDTKCSRPPGGKGASMEQCLTDSPQPSLWKR